MRHAILLVAIAGCGADGNPDILWLGPTSNGQGIKLVADEPFQYWAPVLGPGGSQEATFDLIGGIPAGAYHAVLDAVISASCDVQFDLILRRGGADTVLSTRTEHYDPIIGNFDA